MPWTTGDTVVADFTTRGSTGGVNADSLPTGTLVINGVDDGASVTVTNKSTGSYKASVTLPTVANGDHLQIRMAATVSGISDKAIIWDSQAGERVTIAGIWEVDMTGIALVADSAGQLLYDANNAAGIAALDVYHADIDFTRDQSNTQDEYSVIWMKNGVPQLSGVTVPTIQVINRADASDLIASTAMTDAGSNILTYNATGAERQTQGEAVVVKVTATINAATRTFARILGRDST